MKKETYKTVIDGYDEIIDEETKITLGDLEEKIRKVPKWTSNWVKRLHGHKTKLCDLLDKKDSLKEELVAKFESSDDPRYKGMSKQELLFKIDNSKLWKDLLKDIRIQERVIEYLSEIVSIYKFQMPKALDNLVSLRKLDES